MSGLLERRKHYWRVSLIRGIEVFKNHFGSFRESFVLIGGTACSLVMENASSSFRGTKDIDMVLHIEMLDKAFFVAFSNFIQQGKYSNIQKSSGKKVFYRFEKPGDETFPAMLELFSRKPELINLKLEQHITPIPALEAASDLSAILMNDEYYDLIFTKKIEINGLPVVPAEYLLPLKAHAWLNLIGLKKNGKEIKTVDIIKHKKDVFRLSQLLSPQQEIILPDSVRADLKLFLDTVVEEPFNTDDLEINTTLQIMTDVKDVAAGSSQSSIIKTDGSLYACGRNNVGQLGTGDTTQANSPVFIMTNVQKVAISGGHSLILRNDGTLYACGDNSVGQLGTGDLVQHTSPVQIMTAVQNIAAGGGFSLILRTDGTLWACGADNTGQLGDGQFTNHVATPKQISSNVKSIAAGSSHSLVLKNDGTLFSCGGNYYGQLGIGPSTGTYTLTQVMPNVQRIAAGTYHSVIVKTDGTLWAFGYNKYGQLGDSTTTDHNTPVKLTFQ